MASLKTPERTSYLTKVNVVKTPPWTCSWDSESTLDGGDGFQPKVWWFFRESNGQIAAEWWHSGLFSQFLLGLGIFTSQNFDSRHNPTGQKAFFSSVNSAGIRSDFHQDLNSHSNRRRYYPLPKTNREFGLPENRALCPEIWKPNESSLLFASIFRGVNLAVSFLGCVCGTLGRLVRGNRRPSNSPS